MLRGLFKNTFVRNVTTLISGTAIAQAILFFATPLLTRLYSPEAFGFLSLYLAIVAVITSVSSLKYELAIMLPEKDEDAEALLFLSLLITTAMSLFTLFLSLIVKLFLVAYFDPQILVFIWIIPFGVLFSGFFQIFIAYSSRFKKFSQVSVARISQSGITVGAQSAIKLVSTLNTGLIWGRVFGDFLSVLYIWIFHRSKRTFSLKNLSKKALKSNAVKYRDFPKYQAFAQFLNSLSQNIPFFLLTWLYAPEIAGFYMLTSRVLSAPTQLIAKSTREVYYQKASEMHAKGESLSRLYWKTTIGLAKISWLPFLILAIFAPVLFSWLFGEEWRISGIYAQYVAAWSFLGFINPPSTMNIYIIGLQKFSLIYELSVIILRIFSLYLGYLLLNSHLSSVAFYAIAGVICNMFLIAYVKHKVNRMDRLP